MNLNLERVLISRIFKFLLAKSLAPVIIGHFLNFGNDLFLEIVLSTGNPTEFSFFIGSDLLNGNKFWKFELEK